MWKLWKDYGKKMGIEGHKEPQDRDWLDASYVFYDEKGDVVRVYNRDCVQLDKLKYDYEPSPTPWVSGRGFQRNKKPKSELESHNQLEGVEQPEFPLKLDKPVRIPVKRKPENMINNDKNKPTELLLVKGIKFDSEKFIKFNVFVNDGLIPTGDSTFAGCFAQVPHGQSGKMFMTTAARYGITEVLEDIDAEDDQTIWVTFVPRSGCEDLTIGGVEIDNIPCYE